MHLGHKNVPTASGGNLAPENTALEGASCNLSAGKSGYVKEGMSWEPRNTQKNQPSQTKLTKNGCKLNKACEINAIYLLYLAISYAKWPFSDHPGAPWVLKRLNPCFTQEDKALDVVGR